MRLISCFKPICFFLLLLLTVFSCGKVQENAEYQEPISKSAQEVSESDEISEELLLYQFQNLKTGEGKLPEIDQKDLFGRFFGEQAEYYVIKDPNLFYGGAEVEELTMYFLQDKLFKKKYKLKEDVSSQLIQSFGSFGFTAFASDFGEELSADNILVSEANLLSINSEYERYRIEWKHDGKYITYEFREDSTHNLYLLQEELLAYRSELHKVVMGSIE